MSGIKTLLSQYSKPAIYTILIICFCIILSYVIVLVIIFTKYGKRIFTENIKKLNIATTIVLICISITALIIRFVPFIRYPILNTIHNIPSAFDSILDSGNTPYFNPPVYHFKHGQYLKTDVIPYKMDKFGLPIVDENVPLNSFNMQLFRRYHKADLIEYDIIKNDFVDSYMNNESYKTMLNEIIKFTNNEIMVDALTQHINTIFDTINNILRISTVGETCAIVNTFGRGHILIHKNKYIQFISDPLIIKEINIFNDYKLHKHFRITELLDGLTWLSNKLFNNASTSIDIYNKYFDVYNELRVIYALFITNTTDKNKFDYLASIIDIIIKFTINDPQFGLLNIFDSMTLVSTINYCITGTQNLIIGINNYMKENEKLDMMTFYKNILEDGTSIEINNIFRDVYQNINVINILQNINNVKSNTIIDSLTAQTPEFDINTIEIRILLPYLNEYGMNQIVNVHNRNINIISKNIDGIINKIKNKRNKLIISKLLKQNTDNYQQIKKIAITQISSMSNVESPKLLIASVRKLRGIINKRINNRKKIITPNKIQPEIQNSPELKDIEVQDSNERDILEQIDQKLPMLQNAILSLPPKNPNWAKIKNIINIFKKTKAVEAMPINIVIPNGPTVDQLPAEEQNPIGPTIEQLPAEEQNPIGPTIEQLPVEAQTINDESIPTDNMIEIISSFANNIQEATIGADNIASIVDDTMDSMLELLDTHNDELNNIIDSDIITNPEQQIVMNKTSEMLTNVREYALSQSISTEQLHEEFKQNNETMNKLAEDVKTKYKQIEIENTQIKNMPLELIQSIDSVYNSLIDDTKLLSEMESSIVSSISNPDENIKIRKSLDELVTKIKTSNDKFIELSGKFEEVKKMDLINNVDRINASIISDVTFNNTIQTITPDIVKDILMTGKTKVLELKYKTEIESLRMQQQNSIDELDSKQKQIKEIEDKLELSERKLSQSIEESALIDKQSAEKILILNQQLEETRKKNAELESKKLLTEAELKHIQDDINNIKFDFDTSIISIAQYPDISQVVIDAKNAMDTDIGQTSQIHNNIVNDLQTRINTLLMQQRQTIDSMHQSQLQQEINIHQQKLVEMQAEFDMDIKKSVMDFKLRLIQNIGNIDGININNDSSLVECLNNIASFIEDNKTKSIELSQKIRTLEDREATLLTERDNLTLMLDKMKEIYDTNKIELENSKHELEFKYQSLDAINSGLQEKLIETKNALEIAQTQLAQSQTQMETNISSQKMQLMETIDELNNKNKMLEMQIQDINNQKQSTEVNNVNKNIEEISKLTLLLQEYKSKYEQEVNDYADTKKKLASVINKNNELEDQLDSQRETFAKTMAQEREVHRGNLTYCIGMGGEYKNKKMETLYKLGNVVNFKYEPITNAPKLTHELISAMDTYISKILNGETPIIPSSDPILGKIYSLNPKLVFRSPNEQIRHGSVDWEMLSIIYSIYIIIAMKHNMIMNDLGKCQINEDNIKDFNDNIYTMDNFIANCQLLFNGQLSEDNAYNISLFDFINNNDTIKPIFKKIILLYNNKTHRYEYNLTNDTIVSAFDRVRMLFSIFGFGKEIMYDSLNDTNYELSPEYLHWVMEFTKEVKLKPKERTQQEGDSKIFNPRYGQMLQAIKNGLDEEEQIVPTSNIPVHQNNPMLYPQQEILIDESLL